MTAIGIYDAKTRFSELIEEINTTGEGITITKRGKPVAELLPRRPEQERRLSKEEAIAEMRELRKVMPPLELGEIKRLIDSGRE